VATLPLFLASGVPISLKVQRVSARQTEYLF